MRFSSFLLSVCLSVHSLSARELETHQAAEVVLGQPGFTTKSASSSATGLVFPTGIAIDPTSGKVFVSGSSSVVRYGSATALASGSAAEAIFGQDDFNSSLTGAGANRFGGAIYGLCVDRFGRLWVADRTNHRVLRFDDASNRASGASADRVLGQSNFNTNASAFSATGMNLPRSVSMDPAGTLWVADSGNHRVLGFRNAAGLGSGSAAEIVLGQTTFNAQTSGLTQAKFNDPGGVFADTAGDLWVSDSGNRRVLRFASVTSYAANTTGPNATAVIGQADFTSSAQGVSANRIGLHYPVALDPKGNLFVPAISHGRVLVFPNARSILSGGTASVVLGRADFVSSALVDPPTARSLGAPTGVAFDADGNAWVSDSSNHRVMRFRTIFNTAKLSVKPAKSSVPPGATQKIRYLARNTATIAGDYSFATRVKKGGGFKVGFSLAGKNVTAAVRKGTATARIRGGGKTILTATVRAAGSGKLKLPVTVTPVNNPGEKATANARVTVSAP
jgi:sugar lactone lactonase YvrE